MPTPPPPPPRTPTPTPLSLSLSTQLLALALQPAVPNYYHHHLGAEDPSGDTSLFRLSSQDLQIQRQNGFR